MIKIKLHPISFDWFRSRISLCLAALSLLRSGLRRCLKMLLNRMRVGQQSLFGEYTLYLLWLNTNNLIAISPTFYFLRRALKSRANIPWFVSQFFKLSHNCHLLAGIIKILHSSLHHSSTPILKFKRAQYRWIKRAIVHKNKKLRRLKPTFIIIGSMM